MDERDPISVERDYNSRLAVPEHPRFFERWERDSQFVRSTLEAALDIAYGPDPRHRVDLFPASAPRGLLVFIHGGYWRTLDKSFFSWIAPPFVAAGVSVANVNYRLCPQVRIGQIIDDVIAAANGMLASDSKQKRVVVCGHSAGAHLAAALLCAPRERLSFDPARIAGAVAISGIFDLEPMLHYSANADLRLDAAEARRVSVHDKTPTIAAPLVIAAGELETAGFGRQARLLAQAWASQTRECLILPGLNHFSILDALVERSQLLHSATLALFE